jgi:hypothetical protein
MLAVLATVVMVEDDCKSKTETKTEIKKDECVGCPRAGSCLDSTKEGG